MQKNLKKNPLPRLRVVVLGTGGTIAGTADNTEDVLGYTAGQIGVAQLLQGVPGLTRVQADLQVDLQTEQLAQVDSKDMDFALWKRLAERTHSALLRADVTAVVITHGTDTLEETAYFLYRVMPGDLLARKPVVLTCAMRPASSTQPDGPQNLLEAVLTALQPQARGVLVVCAGQIHSALEVQKVHSHQLDAFASGPGGPVGHFDRQATPHPQARHANSSPPDKANAAATLAPLPQPQWLQTPPIAATDAGLMPLIGLCDVLPRVELVVNHVGAGPWLVDVLLAAGAASLAAVPPATAGPPVLRGLVVAGTGNGSVHDALEAALLRAQGAGVRVVRASRCTWGGVQAVAGQAIAEVSSLSAVKTRIALQLELLANKMTE